MEHDESFNTLICVQYTTPLYKQTRSAILPLVSQPLQQVPALHNSPAIRQEPIGGLGVGGEAVGVGVGGVGVGAVGPLVLGQLANQQTLPPLPQLVNGAVILAVSPQVESPRRLPSVQTSAGSFFLQMYLATVLTGALEGDFDGDVVGLPVVGDAVGFLVGGAVLVVEIIHAVSE